MRRNRCTQTPGAMGFYSRYGQITLAGASLLGTSFWSPYFQRYIFSTVSLPFCGRRGKSLPRTGQNVQSFAKSGALSSRAWLPWEAGRAPKVFFIRNIRLLACRGGTSGPKIAPLPLGCKGQNPTANGNQVRRAEYQYERPSRTLL
jgi:hypothetical protein